MTLREVYDRHADFVWRTLRRLGVPEAELGDALQEVFLLVHAHLHQFEGRSALTTWLFTLCRTVARDARRRARIERQRCDGVSVDDEIDLKADVLGAVERNERVLLLETLLDGMEAPLRTVFILFEIEKLSGEEVAEALRIPLGTVYSRLSAARHAFRQALNRTEARQRFVSEQAGGGLP